MPATPPPEPPHTVQLRHELPDGSWHIDWLIDLDRTEAGRLLTFRLDRRVDDLEAGTEIDLERAADHRRIYLEYEGPLSGGRGEVTRVACGRIEAMQNLGDDWAFLIAWQRFSRQRLRVRRRPDDRWTLQVLAEPRVV